MFSDQRIKKSFLERQKPFNLFIVNIIPSLKKLAVVGDSNYLATKIRNKRFTIVSASHR